MAKSRRKTKTGPASRRSTVGRKQARKIAVLIVGAPRSGTSAISNLLCEMGVEFGKPEHFVDPSVHTHNPIFFELQSLNDLNDRVLGWFGKTYADFDFLPLRSDFTEEMYKAFRPLCAGLLKSEFDNATLIGLKDPRFCFVLPLWTDALEHLGFRVHYLWVQRQLDAVVASNARVNRTFSKKHNVRIAALSTLTAANLLEGVNFLRVNYDDAVANPQQATRAICDWLDLRLDADRIAGAAAALNAKLRTFSDDHRKLPTAVEQISSDALAGVLGSQRYREMVQLFRDIGFIQERGKRERVGEDAAIAIGGALPTVDVGPMMPNQLDTPRPDNAILYWRNMNESFVEERSMRDTVAYRITASKCEFTLPENTQIGCVRFDPSDYPGAFNLRALRFNSRLVADLRSRVRGVNQYVLDRQGNEGVWFASNDTDPWIEFDISDLVERGEPLVVELDCVRRPIESVLGALVASITDDLQQRIHSNVSSSFASVSRQLSEMRDDLRQQAEALQTRGVEQDNESAAGREREARLGTQVETLQARSVEQEHELAEGREREARLGTQVETLQARSVEQDHESAAGREREAQLQQRVETLQSDGARIEAERAVNVEREARTLREAFWLSAKSVELLQNFDAVSTQFAELGRRHDAMSTQFADVGKSHDVLESRQQSLQASNATLQNELVEIRTSTLWRVLVRVRAVLLLMPCRLRLMLRRIGKAMWWIVTPWRMPARIRFLKQRRVARNAGPDISDAVQPSLQPDDGADTSCEESSAAPAVYTYRTPEPNLAVFRQALLGLTRQTFFSVIVPVYDTDTDLLRKTIESVQAQWYPHWELILVDDHSPSPTVGEVLGALTDPRIHVVTLKENKRISGATNEGMQRACGDYVVFLDHDDALTPDCLYELALCIDRDNPDYVYSDEDKLDTDGNYRDPFFKPDWSPDTMMSIMLTCHVSCVRRSLAMQVGGLRSEYDGSQDWDFVLRVTEHTRRISHIPKVLYHWRIIPASCASNLAAKPYAIDASKRAREDALRRRGLSGELVPVPELAGYYRTRYHLQGQPLFSIIIPSKNNGAVLKACIDSIFERTSYRRFEIIVINNGSTDPTTLRYLSGLRDREQVTVIEHKVPFNYSEINNVGVCHANGEIFVFLNDDTEVLSHDWLDYMGGYAQLLHVGAVGAKLLYPGGETVQHTGVINLMPGPCHAFPNVPARAPGYFVRNMLEHDWIAVTGACLMIERGKFEAVGGFDEELAVTYNDIALCFSLVERGYYQVVCPGVELIHHESLSRGNDTLDAARMARLDRERDILFRKHPKLYLHDPFFNPNLAQDDPYFNPKRVGHV